MTATRKPNQDELLQVLLQLPCQFHSRGGTYYLNENIRIRGLNPSQMQELANFKSIDQRPANASNAAPSYDAMQLLRYAIFIGKQISPDSSVIKKVEQELSRDSKKGSSSASSQIAYCVEHIDSILFDAQQAIEDATTQSSLLKEPKAKKKAEKKPEKKPRKKASSLTHFPSEPQLSRSAHGVSAGSSSSSSSSSSSLLSDTLMEEKSSDQKSSLSNTISDEEDEASTSLSSSSNKERSHEHESKGNQTSSLIPASVSQQPQQSLVSKKAPPIVYVNKNLRTYLRYVDFSGDYRLFVLFGEKRKLRMRAIECLHKNKGELFREFQDFFAKHSNIRFAHHETISILYNFDNKASDHLGEDGNLDQGDQKANNALAAFLTKKRQGITGYPVPEGGKDLRLAAMAAFRSLKKSISQGLYKVQQKTKALLSDTPMRQASSNQEITTATDFSLLPLPTSTFAQGQQSNSFRVSFDGKPYQFGQSPEGGYAFQPVGNSHFDLSTPSLSNTMSDIAAPSASTAVGSQQQEEVLDHGGVEEEVLDHGGVEFQEPDASTSDDNLTLPPLPTLFPQEEEPEDFPESVNDQFEQSSETGSILQPQIPDQEMLPASSGSQLSQLSSSLSAASSSSSSSAVEYKPVQQSTSLLNNHGVVSSNSDDRVVKNLELLLELIPSRKGGTRVIKFKFFSSAAKSFLQQQNQLEHFHDEKPNRGSRCVNLAFQQIKQHPRFSVKKGEIEQLESEWKIYLEAYENYVNKANENERKHGWQHELKCENFKIILSQQGSVFLGQVGHGAVCRAAVEVLSKKAESLTQPFQQDLNQSSSTTDSKNSKTDSNFSDESVFN